MNTSEGRVIRRAVGGPWHFALDIHLDAHERITMIGVPEIEMLTPLKGFMVERAIVWVAKQLGNAQAQMFTAQDVLEKMPDGILSEIERMILQEISALQELLSGLALAARDGAK